MSRFFVLPEDGIGSGGDIVFKRHVLNAYTLWVGNIMLGQVWKLRTWTGISHAETSEFFNVHYMEGFATRMDAAGFVIKHHGYWMRDERGRRRWLAEVEEGFAKKNRRVDIPES
jgi:hypothetical protein